MAVHDHYDTDDSAIPAALRRFLRNRAYELSGMILLAGITLSGFALASWSAQDPSFNHATGAVPSNWLGYAGAVVADLLAQHLGLASLAFLFIPLAWVYRLFSHLDLVNFKMSFLNWLFAITGAAMVASVVPAPSAWPLSGGMGGQVGDSLSGLIINTLSVGLKPVFAQLIAFAVGGALMVFCSLRATGLTGEHTREGMHASGRLLGRTASAGWGVARSGAGVLSAGAGYVARVWVHQRANRTADARASAGDGEDILTRLAPARGLMKGKRKIEPTLLDARRRARRFRRQGRDHQGPPRGPVVTLYELEPAPGIKSSRVIGLADDIARSMSAISARVAVVQGRNAIGIELPNAKRETVYLRELLPPQGFREVTKHKLALALGKTIGGEPVIADLAKHAASAGRRHHRLGQVGRPSTP
jgi:S-DNA-T family DNA segregation ATPase FtsK/SpoIIIE